MKFGIRTPSLKRRLSARTSWKRIVRHKMGVKVPRGMGFITNPKKAMYNRIYNKTSFSVDKMLRSNKRPSKNCNPQVSTQSSGGCGVAFYVLLMVIFLFTALPIGIVMIIALIIYCNLPKQRATRILAKANKEYSDSNFGTAIELYKKVLEIDPENIEAIGLLGAGYHNIEQFAEAIPILEKYQSFNPENELCKVLLASSYYRLKKYEKAIPLLQSIPVDSEYFIGSLEVLAGCFSAEGKIDLAIETLKRAPLGKRNLDSILLEVHYNLGLLYEKKEDKKNALKHFQKVFSYDAGYCEVAKKIQTLNS